METLVKVNRLSTILAVVILGCIITACGTKKDRKPNAFSFTDQSNVELSTAVTSPAVVIQGINRAATVSISGGEYAIDGGAFTSTEGTVSNGQSITVRVTSSAEFSTASNVSLTVGGIADTFTVTTLAADTTPEDFSFDAQSDVALETLMESNTITVAGINTAAPVTITGGEYAINGGTFTSEAGAVSEGQSIVVGVTSSAEFSTESSATLSVGGVAATFTVTTLAEDTSPDDFNFEAQTNVALDTDIESNTITVAGINAPAPISVSGGSYSINGADPVTDDATVALDSEVTVSVRSSTAANAAAAATLTIGDVVKTFTVTTVPDITAPTANIVFPPPVSMTEGTSVTIRGAAADDITGVASVVIRVNGAETPVDISAQAVSDYSSWSQSVDLSDGANEIILRVTDVAGNVAESAATVAVTKGDIDDGTVSSAFPDNNNPLSYPVSIAIDSARDRILIGDRDSDAILAVDIATGVRTMFSGPTTPDAENTFRTPAGMLIDPVAENNRVFVGDIAADTLFTVDLTTGARTILSDDTTPDSNLQFQSPREMIINPNDPNEILIADQGLGIKGVKIDSGVRRVFSDDHPTEGRPDSENPFGTVTGIAYDAANERLLVTDSGFDFIAAVSLQDGTRTYLSTNTIPDDQNVFVNPRGIVIDGALNRAVINEVGVDSLVSTTPGLISMDLDTGARNYFSSPTIPDSINALVEPREVHWDGELGYFLVVDRGLNALLAVDIVSGERVIYSKSSSCSDGSC